MDKDLRQADLFKFIRNLFDLGLSLEEIFYEIEVKLEAGLEEGLEDENPYTSEDLKLVVNEEMRLFGLFPFISERAINYESCLPDAFMRAGA